MKPLLLLLSAGTPLLPGQDPAPLTVFQDAPGIAPWSQPGVIFQDSLASAIGRAAGQKKIVVYTVETLQRRNQFRWLLNQWAIWSHPATRLAVQDQPLVALRAGHGEAKSLRLPKNGLTVLDPRGQRVLATLDLSVVEYRSVPATLLQVLKPKTLAPEQRVADVQEQLGLMRQAEQLMLGALRRKDLAAAQQAVHRLRGQLGDHLIPRILDHGLRVRSRMDAALAALPPGRPQAGMVVVVEDMAGFCAALRGWAKGPIYPILFRDSQFLPRFLYRFGDAQLLSIPAQKASPTLSAAEIFATWSTACGATDQALDETTAVRSWKQHKQRSPGLVFTSPESPMLAAGLALAAGRRQLMALIDGVSDPTQLVDWPVVAGLRRQFRELLTRNLIAGQVLFDELDYVSLCVPLPYRYRNLMAVDKSPYAVDDALCRDRFDLPMAFVGRMTGDRIQSTYQAMCALFLQPGDALLFSRYGPKGIWGRYSSPKAAAELSRKMTVTHLNHPAASLAAWQEHYAGKPNTHELIHVNSSGGPRDWSTSKHKGSFLDLPPSLPVTVSYVHSNSMGNPYDRDTIAGRWLRNGAYTFFGSMHEPYLDAFVAVAPFVSRSLQRRHPLGMAHRLFPGQLRWRSWKLMLVGDPLLRLLPRQSPRARVKANAPPGSRPLQRLMQTNPRQLRGLDRSLDKLQIQLLSEGPDKALTAVRRQLRQLQGSGDTLSPDQSRILANLGAALLFSMPQPELARELAGALAELGARTAAFELIATHLFLTELRRLRADPKTKAQQLDTLLFLHAGLGGGRQSYRELGRRYRAALPKGPEGQRRRSVLKRQLRAKIRSGELPAGAAELAKTL